MPPTVDQNPVQNETLAALAADPDAAGTRADVVAPPEHEHGEPPSTRATYSCACGFRIVDDTDDKDGFDEAVDAHEESHQPEADVMLRAIEDDLLRAVVKPVAGSDGKRWHASVRHAFTGEIVAEREVEADPIRLETDELFQGFLDGTVERLGFHRGGQAVAIEVLPTPAGGEVLKTVVVDQPASLLEALSEGVTYIWPAYRIPPHQRPSWADRHEDYAARWAEMFPGSYPVDDLELGPECTRDTDGSLIFDYEHKVGEVRGAAGNGVVETWIMRQDRVERGRLLVGPVRVAVATANEMMFFDIDGVQPDRLVALIEDTARLARDLSTGAAA